MYYLVSFPDPAPLRGKEGLGTLVDFLGILCVSNHVTHAYAHAHFSNKRVIRELRIVSCPGGEVWVAVTREFERDNCVISEILQSDWTIPNRAGVPRKSTKVFPRVGGAVWARDYVLSTDRLVWRSHTLSVRRGEGLASTCCAEGMQFKCNTSGEARAAHAISASATACVYM